MLRTGFYEHDLGIIYLLFLYINTYNDKQRQKVYETSTNSDFPKFVSTFFFFTFTLTDQL